MASTNRSDGDGSLYIRHKPDCPKPSDACGKPTCKCPWQGVIVVDWRDKKPVRRKVTGQSRAAAASRLRVLREEIKEGRIAPGETPPLSKWLRLWLEQEVQRRNKPHTIRTYTTYVNQYLIPLLGDKRLDRLTQDDLQAAWDSLTTIGCPGKENPTPLSSTTAHQAHVILSRALKVAERRGYVRKNVATLMDAPKVKTANMEVLTKAGAQAVVDAARTKRNAARWTVAFTLGLRQGEALGLRWEDVDLNRSTIHVRHSLQRVTGQGLVLGTVKSTKGDRVISLPAPLLADLRAHKTRQNAERLAAGSWWEDHGYVFTNTFGRPVDVKADWVAWRDLLAEAGVPHVRLHAARHTAITMMLAMGVAPHVVKEIAGHARFSTTEGYVDKVDELHIDAANKMAAFWD